MKGIDDLAGTITEHSRVVIVLFLLLSVVFAVGVTMIEIEASMDQFEADTVEAEKIDYINHNFDSNENTTETQIIVQNESVLSKAALIKQLEFQQELRDNETVNETLANESAFSGVANIVATTAIQQEQAADREGRTGELNTTTEEQIEQLESMNESEVEDVVETVLSEDHPQAERALRFLPTGYEQGTTEANATILSVTVEGKKTVLISATPESRIDAEVAMQEIAQEQGNGLEYRIVGDGILFEETTTSMQESLMIVAPFAILFVIIVLIIAYRDILDIILGSVGILLVLLWTIGFLGLADIAFNQVFIAVIVLLIGLSIDYAIHVIMRYREERTDRETDPGPQGVMQLALSGLGVALVVVTTTAIIGFLSNLVSPLGVVQGFGIVSAFGILSAFLIFGIFIPAVKVELDKWLEARGLTRRKRAFGTGGGVISRILTLGAVAAQRAPYAVLITAIVLSAGGAYGAVHVDTSFEQTDFLAEDPPEWTDNLPDALAPSKYTTAASIDYLNEHFVRQDSQVELLIEGNISDPDTLEQVAKGEQAAADENVTATLASGDAAIQSPLTVMDQVADQNESFNQTLTDADTDEDGIPDQNLDTVYDHLYKVAPGQAESVIHRTDDGRYQALRMTVSVEGTADSSDVTEQMRAVADTMETTDLTATATGSIIINNLTEDEISDTVTQSLVVSLITVSLFLMLLYWWTKGSATLGVVTVVPVAVTATSILGTMYLLDISFNVLTGLITSLTIGIGIDYSVHLSERYQLELANGSSVWDAMHTSVTGTGGALLGSAATSAGGFAVLLVAFLRFLQMFGLITALMIVFALLASVLVLPSLLAIWTRYFGPDWARTDLRATSPLGDIPDAASSMRGTPDAAPSIGRSPRGDVSLNATDGGQFTEEPWTDSTASTPPDAPSVAGTVQRSLESAYVRPGQTVEVVVTVRDLDGRFLLRERSHDATIMNVEMQPSAAASRRIGHDGTIHAAWEPNAETANNDPITLQYEATIPTQADDSDVFTFSGSVMTSAGNINVAGDEQVTVVVDVFERVLARETVTQADLAAAYDQYEDGGISMNQLERLYRIWLRQQEDEHY